MASTYSEEELKGSGYFVFGRDVMSIPCIRLSSIYGICTGIGAGLVFYMFTSKPRLANHIGFGTIWITTSVYWSICRYNHYKISCNLKDMQKALNESIGENTLSIVDSFDN